MSSVGSQTYKLQTEQGEGGHRYSAEFNFSYELHHIFFNLLNLFEF